MRQNENSAFTLVSMEERGISIVQSPTNEAKRKSNDWIAIEQSFLIGLLNYQGYKFELTLSTHSSNTMKPFVILAIRENNDLVIYQDDENMKKQEKDATSIERMIQLAELKGYEVNVKKAKLVKKESKKKMTIIKRIVSVYKDDIQYSESMIERNGMFVYDLLKNSLKPKQQIILQPFDLSICEKFNMSIPGF